MALDEPFTLPLAAIVAIVLFLYLLVVLIVAAVWRLLHVKGVLKFRQPSPDDPAPRQCCDPCCRLLSEAFGCKSVSLLATLKSICPQRPLDLGPLVTCPCVSEEARGSGTSGGYLNCVCCEINSGAAGQQPHATIS